MRHAPICAECECEYRCAQNEVLVRLSQEGDCYSGDLYRCPGCFAGVILGIGRAPYHKAHVAARVDRDAERVYDAYRVPRRAAGEEQL